VATTIKVLECFQVPFAVRSGGHQAAHGAAAIRDGILISLDRLNDISYSTDNEMVSFGPGNRWLAVYRHLDQYDRGVTGGHIGLVGTGGQITGGRFASYSNSLRSSVLTEPTYRWYLTFLPSLRFLLFKCAKLPGCGGRRTHRQRQY